MVKQIAAKPVRFTSEIITIETQGDKKLIVVIGAIGSKGVFTEEIAEQLGLGVIDLAVHSAKDLQSRLPAGFELIAFTEREIVNDVLVGHNKDVTLDNGYEELIRKQVNHPETEYRLKAERSYLKTIEGGCSIPAFALAELNGNEMQINGGIISMDGWPKNYPASGKRAEITSRRFR